MFWVEGSAGLPSDGHTGNWVKRVQREMHCSVGGRVQDLPERNTAEDEGAVEAPEGKRSVEVMWLRRGEEGEEGEQMMPEDQRSSVSGMEAVSERRARTRSMALFSARRHSFTLRKLWT